MKNCNIFSGWEIRTRLIAALLWLVGLLFLQQLYTPWLLSALLLILICMDTKLSLSKVAHQLIHVLPFLALMALTLSISDGLPPTKDALLFAGLLCSRVITAVLVILSLTGGRQTEDFIRTLAVLPLPRSYLSLLFLTNRYVGVLVREVKKQSMAMRSRMFTPKANPSVLKNTGYVVGGMFIRGYDRSEQVYAAMRARCYNGVIPHEDARRPEAIDIVKLVASALLLGGIILLERRAAM